MSCIVRAKKERVGDRTTIRDLWGPEEEATLDRAYTAVIYLPKPWHE